MFVLFWIALALGFVFLFAAWNGAINSVLEGGQNQAPEPPEQQQHYHQCHCDDRRANEEHRAEIESYWW
jgi:hypothetical protein